MPREASRPYPSRRCLAQAVCWLPPLRRRTTSCPSPAPARRGRRSRSTPGAPTSGPTAWSSTTPVRAPPTAAREYIQHTVDFAVTEIPFENPPEPGQPAEVPDRPYAYLPIVAGGTSFMYHLTVAGKQVRDLRLSGSTLSQIFTGAITRWNDPRITADNQGRVLPDEAIIPVLRSDGAGASAQFSRYMWRHVPERLVPVRPEAHLGACGLTSFFPTFGQAKSQVGSNGVADYVSASYGEGSIGYVEYAYAKRIDYPVASLLNQAGYYTQPSASDVAIALTKAQINADLTQNLDQVYTNPDPRTYPMSSYSYMVVPTTTAAPVQHRQGQEPVDVHQLLPLRRPAEGPDPGLLAAAQEPRPGRVRPGRQDSR